MTLDEVRRCALSLPEAMEEPHFHYTSFRVRGKIFAAAPPEGEYLHLFVSAEDRRMALTQNPDFLEELHWGKRVAGLRVLLPGARAKVVNALLSRAWSNKAPARLATPPDLANLS